jgi:hypothetical protein
MMLNTTGAIHLLEFYIRLNKMYKQDGSICVEDKTQLKLTSFQHITSFPLMAILNAEQQETKRKKYIPCRSNCNQVLLFAGNTVFLKKVLYL